MTGYTHVMYALHALAGFIGVTSGATVDRRLRVRPAVDHRHIHELRAARCVCAARGSESHFLWQVRTFWTAVVLGHRAVLHCAGVGRGSDS